MGVNAVFFAADSLPAFHYTTVKHRSSGFCTILDCSTNSEIDVPELMTTIKSDRLEHDLPCLVDQIISSNKKASHLTISNETDIKVIQNHRSLTSRSFAEFEQYIPSQGYQADSPGFPRRHIQLLAAGLFSTGSIHF